MYTTLLIFGYLLISFSIIPLIKNDFWVFRVFEFPRLQKLFLNTLWIVFAIYFFQFHSLHLNIVSALILINILHLCYLIYPFTPFAPTQLHKAEYIDEPNRISILIFNIYEGNDEYEKAIRVIKNSNPDVFLLLEANETWAENVQKLDKDYEFTVKVPLNNTYGMLFYSKFELADVSIKYLVEKDIPSIHAKVKLPSGQDIKIHAVHPTPPVPNENPRSTERDKELLMIADYVKDAKLPSIVIGDLNDVAWSYTTELFLKISKLLDPRRGRGYFNTFHAKYPFLRFPLDHTFVSTDFKLVDIKKLDNAGSDHFPIYISLQYEKLAEEQQDDEILDKTAEDVELAEEKLNKI